MSSETHRMKRGHVAGWVTCAALVASMVAAPAYGLPAYKMQQNTDGIQVVESERLDQQNEAAADQQNEVVVDNQQLVDDENAIATWEQLQDAIDALQPGDVITLARDLTAGDKSNALTVSKGKDVIIDMAGHTLDAHMPETVKADGEDFNMRSGRGIDVLAGGKLTLMNGTVTGANGDLGGGVNVAKGGTLVIGGDVVIDGNKYDNRPCNVRLEDGALIAIADGGIGSRSHVGVTTGITPEAAKPVVFTEPTKYDHDVATTFFADNADCSIELGTDRRMVVELKGEDAADGIAGEDVAYVTLEGETQTQQDVKKVSSDTAVMGRRDSVSWYAVSDQVQIDERVAMRGDVNLILCDGAQLSAPQGIQVNEDASLTIWAQEQGTGKLVAGGNAAKDDAAIGGSRANSGKITVNGGDIDARGGDGGAGIGGGGTGAGDVVINGGIVRAESDGRGAGIGDGAWANGQGVVEINGGDIAALGCDGGAGIGSGDHSIIKSITITGGVVHARIDGEAAAIGGGHCGACEEIRITGGEVNCPKNHGYFHYGYIGGFRDANTAFGYTPIWLDCNEDDPSTKLDVYFFAGEVHLMKDFVNKDNRDEVFEATGDELLDHSQDLLGEKVLVPLVCHRVECHGADGVSLHSDRVAAAPSTKDHPIIVHVDVTADEGRNVKAVSVTKASNGEAVPVEPCGNSYQFAMPDDDVDVHVHLDDELLVLLDSNNDAAAKEQWLHAGERAGRPESPVKDGRTFVGWYALGEDGTMAKRAYDFDQPIDGDLTLVAKWKKAPDAPTFRKRSLLPGDAPALQYVVEVPTGKAYDYSGAYMEFQKERSDEVVSVDLADAEKDGNVYTFTFPTELKNWNSKVTATLHYTKNNKGQMAKDSCVLRELMNDNGKKIVS